MLDNLEIAVMMRLNHPRIVAFLGFGEIVDPPLEGDDVPRVGIFVMLEWLYFVLELPSLVLLYVVYDKADDDNEEGPLHAFV